MTIQTGIAAAVSREIISASHTVIEVQSKAIALHLKENDLIHALEPLHKELDEFGKMSIEVATSPLGGFGINPQDILEKIVTTIAELEEISVDDAIPRVATLISAYTVAYGGITTSSNKKTHKELIRLAQ